MGYTEFTGKTVAEAVTAASVKLGLTSDQLEYEVVEEGRDGFLGIGSKDAVIKVISKEEKAILDAENKKAEEEAAVNAAAEKSEEAAVVEEKAVAEEAAPAKKSVPSASDDELKKIASDFLNDVFKTMELEVEMDINVIEEDNGKTLDIDLKGPEMGVIIGKRGQTLDSLQYLTNLAVNRKTSDYTRVKIDTEDYRRRRKETLENLAKNTAHKAIRTGRSVSLDAMNPYERRIIHAALADNNKVSTHSEGEEPNRHVVVTLKK